MYARRIFGKQHRLPFSKSSWRTKVPLKLVHTDIWGPATVPSLAGKRYFLLFIDDYTHKTRVYSLENKSEAFLHFTTFKALTEKQCGHSLKILRSGHGGEFTSNEF